MIEVSDEDVDQACEAGAIAYTPNVPFHLYSDETMEQTRRFTRAALESFAESIQADRQRGGDVLNSSAIRYAIQFIKDSIEGMKDDHTLGGICICKERECIAELEALLAQRGQVREGLHECPTCGGPCDMFEEEGTFEIAYIYRSTSK